MNTILVWILVATGGYGNDTITYSPQFADLASCEAVQKSVSSGKRYALHSQCIQVKVIK
jgi:hypothetical protein